jgi:hypothetical protein
VSREPEGLKLGFERLPVGSVGFTLGAFLFLQSLSEGDGIACEGVIQERAAGNGAFRWGRETPGRIEK